VSAFRRRIPAPAQRQALTIATLAVIAVVSSALVLMATNDLGLSPALFEAVSAFATVGLSAGVTPALDEVGQALLVPLMLLGRVGPLTLAVALALRERERLFSHPEERPLVG
jgi:Trk-type K+ transport system membrane component